MKIIVYHTSYGCDTGCCGHIIGAYETERDLDQVERGERGKFDSDHPYDGENPRVWAEQLVREEFGEEHVADLDWENCVVSTN
jgi:hypothetical protein